jgi:hypothetical protein
MRRRDTHRAVEQTLALADGFAEDNIAFVTDVSNDECE